MQPNTPNPAPPAPNPQPPTPAPQIADSAGPVLVDNIAVRQPTAAIPQPAPGAAPPAAQPAPQPHPAQAKPVVKPKPHKPAQPKPWLIISAAIVVALTLAFAAFKAYKS